MTNQAAEPTPVEIEAAPARPRVRPAWRLAIGALLLLAAVVFPFIFNDYLVRAATTIVMLGVLAESWNMLGGFAGSPSFGHAAFFGLGVYGAAIPMVRLGVPFPIGFVMGGLLAGLVALVIGIPVLRLRGHYFAIATLGILSVAQQVVVNLDKVTGGGAGLTLPIPPLDVQTFDEVIYLVMLALLVAAVAFTWGMARSRLGFGLVAIRENEVAARVMGVNTTLYKVIALTASAIFAGFAGAAYAYWLTSIDPTVAFDFTYNVLLVVMAFFGGAGTVLGPVFGAAILGVVSEWLRGVLVQYHLLVFGVVVIVTVVFAPHGLLDLVRSGRRLSLAQLLANVRENSV